MKGFLCSRLLAATGALGLSALSSGCGGFSGSHSVSPASILLPGLLRVDPAPSRVPGRVDPQMAALPDPSSAPKSGPAAQLASVSSVRAPGH